MTSMSMNYYRLKAPVTSVRLETNGGHDYLTIWEHKGNAGTLTLTRTQGIRLVFALTDWDNVVAHTWYGGDEKGVLLQVNDPSLHADLGIHLVNELGETTTFGEVLKMGRIVA